MQSGALRNAPSCTQAACGCPRGGSHQRPLNLPPTSGAWFVKAEPPAEPPGAEPTSSAPSTGMGAQGWSRSQATLLPTSSAGSDVSSSRHASSLPLSPAPASSYRASSTLSACVWASLAPHHVVIGPPEAAQQQQARRGLAEHPLPTSSPLFDRVSAAQSGCWSSPRRFTIFLCCSGGRGAWICRGTLAAEVQQWPNKLEGL